MKRLNEFGFVSRTGSCGAACSCLTHQRGEKGVRHGEFLYLVSEGDGSVRPGREEDVLHLQLAQVDHDHPGRPRAFGDDQNRSAGVDVQQNPGCPLRLITHLQEEDRAVYLCYHGNWTWDSATCAEVPHSLIQHPVQKLTFKF